MPNNNSSALQTAQRSAARKGPRPKHIPVRMCIACRTKDAKRTYVRLVRTPEMRIEVDPTGKRNGRGAYLCQRRSCWQRAIDGNALENAFKIQVDAENKAELREYARSYFPPEEQS